MPEYVQHAFKDTHVPYSVYTDEMEAVNGTLMQDAGTPGVFSMKSRKDCITKCLE